MTFNRLVATLACVITFSGGIAHALNDWGAEFECDAPKWTSGPTVANGVFNGRLEGECRFAAIHGGTFAQLNVAMEQEVVDKSDEVHSGPTPTVFDQLPAVHYDVTSTQSVEKMEAEIRANVYLATDNASRYLYFAKSKSISGSGMATNLKSLEAGFEIHPTAPDYYTVRFFTELEVTKPKLVSVAVFQREVVKNTEAKLESTRKEMIENFLNIF